MTHPIDIIANAIRAADGNHALGAGQLAEVVAETLTDERIVATAVQAMIDRGYAEHIEDALVEVAGIVLRSVAGGV